MLAYWILQYLTLNNSQNEYNHCWNRNLFLKAVNVLHTPSHINEKTNKQTKKNKKKKPVGSMKMHKEVGYDRMTGASQARMFAASFQLSWKGQFTRGPSSSCRGVTHTGNKIYHFAVAAQSQSACVLRLRGGFCSWIFMSFTFDSFFLSINMSKCLYL